MAIQGRSLTFIYKAGTCIHHLEKIIKKKQIRGTYLSWFQQRRRVLGALPLIRHLSSERRRSVRLRKLRNRLRYLTERRRGSTCHCMSEKQ